MPLGTYPPYTMYPWGDTIDGSQANYHPSNDPFETGSYPWTTPVGFYSGALHSKADFGWPGSQSTFQTSNAENGHGLFDTSGNVGEWCWDWYDCGYYGNSPSHNPTGPQSGSYRVYRGGGWGDTNLYRLRSAARLYTNPTGRSTSVGFRVLAVRP